MTMLARRWPMLALVLLVGSIVLRATEAYARVSTLQVDKNDPGCSDNGSGTATRPTLGSMVQNG